MTDCWTWMKKKTLLDLSVRISFICLFCLVSGDVQLERKTMTYTTQELDISFFEEEYSSLHFLFRSRERLSQYLSD